MANEVKKGRMNGSERAAVLLMTLGEADAAEVLKHMTPKEVQKIGEAMAQMANVPKESVTDVLGQFCDAVDEQTELGIGNEDYLKTILNNALGEDKAKNIIDRILLGSHSKGLDSLKWMEPRSVADIIRLEHPQIIAIVLSYLEQDQAADVLSALPENMRVDIMMRIATLDGIQPSAIHELDEMLEKQFSGNSDAIRTSAVGGIKTAANIMNFMDSSLEAEIIEKIKELDDEIGTGIQDHMFVFENLVEVDDRGIQALLREVSADTLILALKGADEGVKEKIFKNMSRRAGEMLRDDLESRGPVKLSEVEAGQKEILTVARRMAETGEISLGGKGGDEYV
jgi:flagellar motor switch protein FliG